MHFPVGSGVAGGKTGRWIQTVAGFWPDFPSALRDGKGCGDYSSCALLFKDSQYKRNASSRLGNPDVVDWYSIWSHRQTA